MRKNLSHVKISNFLALVVTCLLFTAIFTQARAENPIIERTPFPAKETRILDGLMHSGWDIPFGTGKANIPDVEPALVRLAINDTQESESLTAIYKKVLETGTSGSLPGQFCTALGITTGNAPCQLKALWVDPTDSKYKKIIMAGNEHGRTDIVIIYRTKPEGTLFLTSSHGQLKEAVHFEHLQPPQHIPLDKARADFEREKAFWIERLK
ncbi:MAG: hypothetical protein WCU88_03915 [Elusimicrobiota bacterium]|jgi:hypothetical protein